MLRRSLTMMAPRRAARVVCTPLSTTHSLNTQQRRSSGNTGSSSYSPHITAVALTTLATFFCSKSLTQSEGNSEGSSVDSATKTTGFRPPTPAFGSFMKELRMLLRAEQINVDSDDCKDRGKPWNSYHKIDNFPQV